jgi:hypothetical protein
MIYNIIYFLFKNMSKMSTDTSLFTKPILGDLLFKINDAVNERICLFFKFYGISFNFKFIINANVYALAPGC